MSPFSIHLQSCARGRVLPLAEGAMASGGPAHRLEFCSPNGSDWRVGTLLTAKEGHIRLKVVGRAWLAVQGRLHMANCPLLEALDDLPAGSHLFQQERRGWALGWITLSDRGASGERQDESGPLLAEILEKALPIIHSRGFLLPDEPLALRSLVTDLALTQGYDLIVTSGGTGLSPRDTTPEALAPLLERRLPGFEQLMLQKGLTHTPLAALSRAIAGTLGQSLVISLPGSRKAVAENIEAILPILGHALDKLQGDSSDCGR